MRPRSKLGAVALVVALAGCSGASPSVAPSVAPTAAPSQASAAPTAAPTSAPTQAPTAAPSAAATPTVAPTTPPSTTPTGSISFERFSELTPIWHPVAHETGAQSTSFPLIFDTLVKTAPDSRTIVPGLADTWEVSSDARVFTFHLNPNAKWHDGQPVTAEDVVFTVTWSNQNHDAAHGWLPSWWYVEGAEAINGTTNPLSGIKAIDDHTVEITLANPNAEFLRGITNASNSIVPKHLLDGVTAAEVEKIEFSTSKPIGSGPFKFVGHQTGQYIEFAANPDYFRGSPKVAKVFVKLLAPEAVLAALESGDLDIATRIAPIEAERLSANPNLTVLSASDAGFDRLFINTDAAGVLGDKRVRQAMFYAIDRDAIVNAVLQGRGRPLFSVPGFKEYDDLNTYPYDPEKAKQLLAEAGFDASRPVRITYNQAIGVYPTVMPIIQQYLQDVGMTVELKPLDATAWGALVTDPERRGEWDAFLQFGGSEALSPDETSIYFDCKRPTFSTGYQNCEMMDLFAKARSSADEVVRDEAYHQIARFLNEDVPILPIWQGQLTIVANKRVQGFTPHVQDRESSMSVLDWSVTP